METETGQSCIPNISKAERQKRLRNGLVMFVVGLVFLAVLVISGITPLGRLVIYPFFAAAASGFFQWRDKT